MHSKLEEIINKTKEDLEIRKKQLPLEQLKKLVGNMKVRSFLNAIKNPKFGSIAIISEVKFASPTEESLGSPDELLSRVKKYEKAGADAISTVTERHFFHGNPDFVVQIKKASNLPILQKDFVLDEYQIYEIAKDGADAILLIAKLLNEGQLKEFVQTAQELGLEPVVEINDEDDLKKAIITDTEIIAVNARDLASFVVDVDRACSLLQKIPSQFVKLGFSGISSNKDVEKYKQVGAKGVLIGTSLMKAKSIMEYIEGVRV